MANHEKKAPKTPRGAKQASPKTTEAAGNRNPVAWLITGFAMGLVVALIVHLEHTRPDAEPAAAATDTAQVPAGDSHAPRFEFYQLLSEQQVEVATREQSAAEKNSALPSADDMDAPAAAPAQTTSADGTATSASEADTSPAETVSGVRYLLQAGSFRRTQDAEALRAELGLLGIEANIQRVELPGGETWHRVRIGPYSALGRVNEVRARMASQNIESILLRAGG